ncbi:hypothetical protein BS50DRAFT_118752 [Corynespora cassiicola Philippines]|uniref:Sugar phosphate phosphatase n=1 Tax=Corynespora cassiicola Philippines TaxID=1448308 RepID=A0A2T2NAI7_CORCC|nr:hypothetical protein BS50DRAFT_118752 [Corynespora cassiicola Philippines]
MARKFLSIKNILPNSTEDDKRLVFIALTLVSMWGEPEGLALLENLSIDRLKDSRSQAVICEGLRYIVDNDTEAVWQYLQGQEGDDRAVDVILGDAGFELFADIIYAAYLIEAGMASRVNIHPKDYPWFVTNATASDISEAFLFLSPGDEHGHRDALNELMPHLRHLFESKKICVVQHPFWTTAHRYEEMDSWAPELFDSLQSSSLVIFKGELNYRKLTGDVAWHPSTDFKTSLGKLGRGSNLQILALGRNKADTCVGVGENSLKVLEKKSPNGAWRTDGQYGKVSFSDGL